MPSYMTSTAAKVFLSVARHDENSGKRPQYTQIFTQRKQGGENTKGQGWSCAETAALHQQGYFWVTWAWHRAVTESSGGIPVFHQKFWLLSELVTAWRTFVRLAGSNGSYWCHASSAGRQAKHSLDPQTWPSVAEVRDCSEHPPGLKDVLYITRK